MKPVVLTITGQHAYDETGDDAMEFVTEGKLYDRNGTIYLTYDESYLTGMPGIRTRLKLEPDKVHMTRRGKPVGIDTEIHFEKGKRYQGYYDTEFGPIEMEVLTNELINNVTMEDGGDVDIDYHISLKGLAEGRSRLKINVRS